MSATHQIMLNDLWCKHKTSKIYASMQWFLAIEGSWIFSLIFKILFGVSRFTFECAKVMKNKAAFHSTWLGEYMQLQKKNHMMDSGIKLCLNFYSKPSNSVTYCLDLMRCKCGTLNMTYGNVISFLFLCYFTLETKAWWLHNWLYVLVPSDRVWVMNSVYVTKRRSFYNSWGWCIFLTRFELLVAVGIHLHWREVFVLCHSDCEWFMGIASVHNPPFSLANLSQYSAVTGSLSAFP